MKLLKKAIWLTGLSGAGKSTISHALYLYFRQNGINAVELDGDVVRSGINKDLGFSLADRHENIRRVAEIAKLFLSAEVIPICAFISPTVQIRELAKTIIGEEQFIEVHVSTPLNVCEQRDVKGLYKKARNGEISNFTGIHSPFEISQSPDIQIDTSSNDLDETMVEFIKKLNQYLIVS